MSRKWQKTVVLLYSGLVATSWIKAAPCLPGTLPYGDFDARGDVALFDVEVLVDCLSGPNLIPSPTPPRQATDCLQVFNTDSDTNIDLVDVARFQRLFTGACQGLGACPPGTHLEHRSGVVGEVNEDSSDVSPLEPSEYLCVPDESCDDVNCSGFGECQKIAGKAACACQPGYAGENCNRCAVGFERSRTGTCELGAECRERFCSGQGDCVLRDDIGCDCDPGAEGEYCERGGGNPSILRAPTYVEISGTDRSLELGTPRQMCATLFGGGLIDTQLNWSIVGPGTLTFGDPGCRVYVPPPAGTFADSQIVQINVCSLNFPDQCATRYLTIDPPGAIASTGQAHHLLKPFDDNIKRFMRYRCIGGAVLGISIFGKPVYVRGYGNLSGAPTNDPAYLSACGDHFNVSNLLPGYPLPAPQEVQPNTPFRIGSNSKAVTAAIVRKAVKAEILTTDTDDNVEALRLCDGVVPPEIHDVICMGAQPPLPLSTISGLPVDCDDETPCPYGGTCVVVNPMNGEGFCANCPPGFSGLDCSRNVAFCDPAEADDRWEDVTLGHLMGHRSGLPRSVPDRDRVILPNLYRFRDLMVQNDWANQESILTSEGGFPSGSFNMEFPDFGNAKADIGNDAYFVPRPTNTEVVLARMGSCLLYTPGTSPPSSLDPYSNTAYALLGIVAESITGDYFGGTTGKPQQHQGSLLKAFNDHQLKLPVPGQGTADGMYISQGRFELRHPKEPVWRSWTTDSGGSYYKLVRDEKRPYCDWISNECNFTAWINGTDKFDWAFKDRTTLRTYEGSSTSGPATAGSLAVEAEVYLRFMAKYWVGGSGTNPRYGETRCPNGDCIWTLSTAHTGALRGTFSDVKQLGGPVRTNTNCSQDSDCSTYTACQGTGQDHVVQPFCLGGKCHRRNEFFSPPLDPVTGVITDDFANPVCRSCRLPVGVDIFVAFNQWDDKKCYEASLLGEGDENYYSCSDAYNLVAGFLGDAVCKIPWPPNPFVLWPPVFQNGGSSMSPGFSVGP